jgi:hypothetical protein
VINNPSCSGGPWFKSLPGDACHFEHAFRTFAALGYAILWLVLSWVVYTYWSWSVSFLPFFSVWLFLSLCCFNIRYAFYQTQWTYFFFALWCCNVVLIHLNIAICCISLLYFCAVLRGVRACCFQMDWLTGQSNTVPTSNVNFESYRFIFLPCVYTIHDLQHISCMSLVYLMHSFTALQGRFMNASVWPVEVDEND